MIHLYENVESGNCYKIRLLFAHLGTPYTSEQISVTGDRDAHRRRALLQKNPVGKVPTVVLEDGAVLGESTALLWYFGEGTPYIPAATIERARVIAWLAFEQNNLEPNIAVARHQTKLDPDAKPSRELIEYWQRNGNRALEVMERHLDTHDWFAAGRYTIADIGLYAYSHVADEGPFDLEPFPAVRAWHKRVTEQPGYVPMRPES